MKENGNITIELSFGDRTVSAPFAKGAAATFFDTERGRRTLEYTNLRMRCVRAEQKVCGLVAEIDRLRDENQALIAENEAAERKIARLQADLKESREHDQATTFERSKLALRISQLCEKRDGLEAQLAENQLAYDETETDLLTQISERDDRIERFERLVNLIRQVANGSTLEDLQDVPIGDILFAFECGLFSPSADEPERLRESGLD